MPWHEKSVRFIYYLPLIMEQYRYILTVDNSSKLQRASLKDVPPGPERALLMRHPKSVIIILVAHLERIQYM